MPALLRVPRDSDEVDEEKSELRELVDRFDNLYEDCWRGRLRQTDQMELDQLNIFLRDREAEVWRDTAMLTIDRITELVDIPFPMLRYTIGMLPE